MTPLIVPLSLQVPERAIATWRAFVRELDSTSAPVPCRVWVADLWLSDRPDERQSAAYLCRPCPVLSACGSYATAAGEQFGVWGGTDRNPMRGRPAKGGRAR